MKNVEVGIINDKIVVSKDKLYMGQKGSKDKIKIKIKTQGWYFPTEYDSGINAYGIKFNEIADGEFEITDRSSNGKEVTISDKNSTDLWYKYDIMVVDDPGGSNPTEIIEDPLIKNGGPDVVNIRYLKATLQEGSGKKGPLQKPPHIKK